MIMRVEKKKKGTLGSVDSLPCSCCVCGVDLLESRRLVRLLHRYIRSRYVDRYIRHA